MELDEQGLCFRMLDRIQNLEVLLNDDDLLQVSDNEHHRLVAPAGPQYGPKDTKVLKVRPNVYPCVTRQIYSFGIANFFLASLRSCY
jgi:hypothetical protein